MYTTRSTTYRLLYQLALLVLVYFVCRLLFVVVHFSSLNVTSVLGCIKLFVFGLKFDAPAILITNSLYVVITLLTAPFVLHRYFYVVLNYLFIVVNSCAILVNLIDIGYFPFIHKRMQFDAFLFLDGSKGNDFYRLLPTFLLQYWYLLFVLVLLIYGLIKGYNKTLTPLVKVPHSVKHYLLHILTFVVMAGLSIIAIRGGLQLRPISIISASELTEVQNIPALLNSPFSIINTISQERLKEINYYSSKEMRGAFSGVIQPKVKGKFIRQNVVIIIVEGLSSNYLSYNNGQVHTPFLDSLCNQSLVFTNGFANATESVQGIPAVLSGTPSWQEEPFIFSPYSSNRITSLANLLKPKGYTSSFFHGGTNGTMGFDSYCKLAEFDNYYGRTEYANEADYDGNWGIWDEPYLQYVSDKLSATKQPFVGAVFTLNTHHPFTIPTKYKQRFKTKGHPNLACVQYLDYSLAQFFKKAKKTKWFKNTIFVITADHTGPFTEPRISNILNANYKIPIVFYSPRGYLKGKNSTIANQIDILPTVMHLLNYPAKYYTLGKNLFNKQVEHFSINYNGGIYQYIDTSYIYHFNGRNGIGFYNWKLDSLYTNNMLNAVTDTNLLKHRADNLKKMIQLYTNSMINNEMNIANFKKK
jgi:phosphoglycerol transferase MdoB-like AlkP superfamily enzyme